MDRNTLIRLDGAADAIGSSDFPGQVPFDDFLPLRTSCDSVSVRVFVHRGGGLGGGVLSSGTVRSSRTESSVGTRPACCSSCRSFFSEEASSALSLHDCTGGCRHTGTVTVTSLRSQVARV